MKEYDGALSVSTATVRDGSHGSIVLTYGQSWSPCIACDESADIIRSILSVNDVNDVPEVDNNQVFYLMERSDVDTLVTKDVSGVGDPAPIAASGPDPGQELLFDFDDCWSSLSDTNYNVLDADFYDAGLIKNVNETVMERLQKAEEVLRLRYTKPLKAWESTLDACLNLKIKSTS